MGGRGREGEGEGVREREGGHHVIYIVQLPNQEGHMHII